MNNISTLAKKFAIRIKFERIKKKLSQEKLAGLAGIGRTTLTQIEGQTSSPTLDVVEKLAKALGFEPYELFIFNNLQI
ncbi:MAG: helix-turn-helix domain-containing protein [Heliobacteriaceae bacterium]|jgi:transcriptional regulator with XRE-family HTH domain|nr:helix-turn-helix domain-containing protein [Heliobacteriaceae bacterium]